MNILYLTDVNRTGFLSLVNNKYVEKIILPDNPYVLRNVHISGCPKLKYLQIGNTNFDAGIFDFSTYVYFDSFFISDCPNITSISLPEIRNSVKSLCRDRFLYNMPKLTSITCTDTDVWKKVSYIGDYAFYNCGLTDISSMFNGSTVLTRVGNHVFSKCSNLKNATSTFRNCPSLTSVGTNLLSDCPLLSDVYRLFIHSAIKSIPEKLLWNCTSLINAGDLFYETPITGSIPNNFLYNCNNLSYVYYMFFNCKNITGPIPSDLFSTHNELLSVSHLFYGCTSLTSTIPNNFLNNCTKLTKAQAVFCNCKKITGQIPSGFLSNSPNITDLTKLFEGSGISGAIPTGFLDSCKRSLINVSYMFKDTAVTSIPTHFLYDDDYEAVNITDVSYIFDGCTSLTGPTGRFTYRMRKLKNMSFAFRNCSNLEYVGFSDSCYFTIDNVALENAESTFQGCTKLKITSNNAYILSNVNDNLITTANMFNSCTSLTAINMTDEHKSKFMTKCPKLKYVDGMFAGCTSLTSLPLSDNFLSDCPELVWANSLFGNCRKLIFAIPRNFLKKSPKISHMASTFLNCKNLTDAIPDNFLQNRPQLEYVHYLFDGCSNITGSIPINFLKGCTKIRLFERLFAECSKLTGNIPPLFSEQFTGTRYSDSNYTAPLHDADIKNTSLFNNCIGLTGTIPAGLFAGYKLNSLNRCFSGCTGLTGIENGFLSKSISNNTLTSAISAFEGTGLTSIPDYLFLDCTNITEADSIFKNCSSLTSINGVFKGCTGLTKIPVDFIKGCSALKDCNYIFYYCTNISGELDPQMFAECTDLSSILTAFAHTKIHGSIPDNFLSNCKKLINTAYMFYATTISGSIPDNLLEGCTLLKNTKYMFCNCTSLNGSIPTNFLADSTKLYDVDGMFKNCRNITGSIPSNFLCNHSELSLINSTFENCSGLTGEAPPYWTIHQNTQHENTFSECTGLTNYNSIPADWK